jgi:hypothetical protein
LLAEVIGEEEEDVGFIRCKDRSAESEEDERGEAFHGAPSPTKDFDGVLQRAWFSGRKRLDEMGGVPEGGDLVLSESVNVLARNQRNVELVLYFLIEKGARN